MTTRYIDRKRKELSTKQANMAKANELGNNKRMVDIPNTIKTVDPVKVYSMYIEILAHGTSKDDVQGNVEDILDDIFGSENYSTYEVQELTQDQVIEIETGIHDMEDLDKEYDEASANEGV